MNAAAPYLDALRDMAPLVAAEAERSEREARTTPAVNERIIEAGLYRLWLPRSIDAPEMPMPTAIEVFEAASRIDGSFGWAVTIGTGGGLFAGALEPATKAEVFGPKEALIAGSGKPGGTARPVDSGYLAGGHWNFASGAHHATFFTANCILEGERPADGSDGPVIRAMAFPASEVEIIENWDPAGMRDTGSHDFRVESSLVPLRRTLASSTTGPSRAARSTATPSTITRRSRSRPSRSVSGGTPSTSSSRSPAHAARCTRASPWETARGRAFASARRRRL